MVCIQKEASSMDLQQYFSLGQSRRSVLRELGSLASVSLALNGCGGRAPSGNTPVASGPGSIDSIQHIVIACQENRTFDTYFGFYPKAGSFGIPHGYAQSDGKGGTVQPYHFQLHDTKDVAHDWQTIHREWDNGKMAGFYLANGKTALAYYELSAHPFYYAPPD